MGGASAPDNLDAGHRTQVWLAVSDDKAAMVTGKYFFTSSFVHRIPPREFRTP
jgi:hypothetical protein